MLCGVHRVRPADRLVNVIHRIRKYQKPSARAAGEVQLVESLPLLRQIRILGKVVAPSVEPVAGAVLDRLFNALFLDGLQIQHILQRLVVFPEQLVRSLEPRHDPQPVQLDCRPRPILQIEPHPWPAVPGQDHLKPPRHDHLNAHRAPKIVQLRRDKQIVLAIQHARGLIQKFRPCLPAVRPAVQQVLQAFLRCALEFNLQLRAVSPVGVQARPDHVALIDGSIKRPENRGVSGHKLKRLRRFAIRPPFGQHFIKESHFPSSPRFSFPDNCISQ